MCTLRLLLIGITLVLFGTAATAQISDSLYNALPATAKPLHKAALTNKEKQHILLALDDMDVLHYGAELRLIADYLKADAANAKYADIAINDLYALTKYYAYFIKDSIIPGNKRLLSYINGNSKYNKIAETAYLNLGEYYVYGSQHDSAVNTLHAVLNIAAAENDSTAACYAYGTYSVLFSVLYLFDSSLYYQKLALRFSPVKNKWSVDYTQNIIGLAVDYVNLYGQEMQSRYSDSAHKLIYMVMAQKKYEPQYWYGACYFLLGRCAYLGKQYASAISLFDSSLAPAYNTSSKYYANYSVGRYLYKAECLIKLGKFAQGKKILDSVKLPDGDQPTWHQLLYQALNEYAEGIGDYKSALLYYKKYKLFTDTFNLEGQKGRLFLAKQKYSVKEEEASIAVLENQNLQALATRNKIAAAAIIVVLLLGMAFYIRNSQQRHQRALALASQRRAISSNMHDEVSSSLATLRYLITDLKIKAANTETKAVLADLEEEARQVYIQSRNFVHHINNEDVQENYNLTALLQKLALRYNPEDGDTLHVGVNADEDAIEEYFTPQQHAEMYRVIQEAVANSMKHSGATEINITVEKKGNMFYFNIKDNGIGANMQAAQTGMGLRTIKKRLAVLKGQVNITSSSSGTVISGSFPAGSRVN